MSSTDLSGPHPDLLGLLRGELSNARATAAGEHLRDCDQCRQDLVDAAVGHGLLTRSVEALGLDLPAPSTPAPVVSGTGSRGRGLRLVAAAAALVLTAGTATALVRATRDAPSPAEPAPVAAAATAELTPVTPALDPSGDGQVRMVGDGVHHTRMTIRVSGLPSAGTDEYYYAWLLDPGTQKMLPLGQVTPGGAASFDLDDDLVGSYSAIDISLETDDGDPAHSVTSVLRGGYDPTQVPS